MDVNTCSNTCTPRWQALTNLELSVLVQMVGSAGRRARVLRCAGGARRGAPLEAAAGETVGSDCGNFYKFYS